ncbi:CPBP family intramembrane metalloprotease [candidate division WOR-3 bacterium]|nr:CPBP family intramembrane metalloprotease [candidate division WOR-3 bacterium]
MNVTKQNHENNKISWGRIGLFLAIAFLPVWILAWVPEWINADEDMLPVAQIVWAICMLFPAASAFMVPAIIKGKTRTYKKTLVDYGLNFKRWWFIIIGWGLPVILGFIALGITLLTGWGSWDPSGNAMLEELHSMLPAEQYAKAVEQMQNPLLVVLMYVQPLTIGAIFNSIFTFGEEFGWRGLLQTELKPAGYWKSSLLIGVIWGIWHIPFIVQGHNYPDEPLWGTFMMVAFCILGSLILGYLRLRSGSVFPAVIYHAVLNGTVGVFLMLSGAPDRFLGPGLGASGFIAMIITLVFFILFDFRFFFPRKKGVVKP